MTHPRCLSRKRAWATSSAQPEGARRALVRKGDREVMLTCARLAAGAEEVLGGRETMSKWEGVEVLSTDAEGGIAGTESDPGAEA